MFKMAARDKRGRYSKTILGRKTSVDGNYFEIDHNYTDTLTMCNGQECNRPYCESDIHIDLPNNVKRDGWRVGMRVLDLGFLLDNLKCCSVCRLGPVPLTNRSVVGELRKGLGGFLYVKCQNIDCGEVNRVPYCKTHRVKKRGMPCFTANTNLGIAMIDSVGGAGKVNNLLSTLNIQPIHRKNLKHIERRSGSFVEDVAENSIRSAAKDAFKKEMSDIANEETEEAAKHMEGLIDDLGVCPMPDASPSLKERIQQTTVDFDSPASETPAKHYKRKFRTRNASDVELKAKKKLMPKFPCKRRYGMSCAVDTAWQKRGFDSQTAHTFFMSKSRYGKKIVKGIVSHRQCSTCTWWRRNRPGKKVREHRCVRNHTGSARLMESTSGEKGVLELANEGTPVEYIEGDGDTTLLARLKNNQNISLKKRFDKNHIMKNIGKSLYSLQSQKGVKLSKNTIIHLQKCISYALSKNSGNEVALQENLCAIVPHNFGDHQLCKASFCGQLRTPDENFLVLVLCTVYRHIPMSLHSPILVKTVAGISPGKHTIDYADKCQKKRQHSQEVTQLPSTKKGALS
ncbi:uncharacterized protein LOC132714462 isoform X2 [Ruditapes philippinarum]|uniref:uncharacterized protein LOC132714462 isoform X2 n=1 Tax=Ruditapes philippinarum TaxID=129788 RepID=UPI00295AD9DF|nr:uncharacterized protein LOC132714462 isoform X2 [Ruditapes philippinarum]